MKPKCILFAGPGGCSKTPVAYFLSWNLGLPIFNNDTIRTEVTEDKLEYIPQDPEYLKRRNERLKLLLNKHTSFIFDASIDRDWKAITEALRKQGYDYFIISYDLSKDFLIKRGVAKNYGSYAELTETWHSDHETFLRDSGQSVGLTINDDNFNERLSVSLAAVKGFLDK
jgi:hypothetical protein